jgi:hypothetical protein
MSLPWQTSVGLGTAPAMRYDHPYSYNSQKDYTGSHSNAIANGNNPNDTTDKYAMYRPFFGPPTGNIHVEAEKYFDRENKDLPEAYRNKQNDFMANIYVTRVTQEEKFATSYLFPIELNEDSMVKRWNSTVFSPVMMDRVSEEGVPRMTSFKETYDQVTMVRYAKSWIMEMTFMKTPEGQRHYFANNEVIVNGMLETLEYGAIYQAMNWPLYEDTMIDMYRNRDNLSGPQLYQQFMREFKTFGCLHKSPTALKNVLSDTQTSFKTRNGGDMRGCAWVLPSGTGKFNADNLPFWMTGNPWNSTLNALDMAKTGGVSYWESRQFRRGENRENVDPMTRNRTAGGFMHITDDHLRTNCQNGPADYKSKMLWLRVYDEEIDDYKFLDFKTVFNHMGLFDRFANDEDGCEDNYAPLSEIGHSFFAQTPTWGKFLRKNGRLQWFVNSLASKSAEVQQDFFNVVVREVNNKNTNTMAFSSRGGTGGGSDEYKDDAADENEMLAVEEDVDDGSSIGIPASRIFDGDRINQQKISARASSSSSSQQYIPQRPEYDESASVDRLVSLFPNSERDQITNVVQLFHAIDERHDTRVLQAYEQSAGSDDKIQSINEDVWVRFAPTLVSVDVDAAVDAIQRKTAYKQTPLEQIWNRASSKDIDRSIADGQGPRWLAFGKDQTPAGHKLRLYTTPNLEEEDGGSVELAYGSLAFSLASTNLVGWALSEMELNYLKGNGGRVEVDGRQATQFISDSNRLAQFQYSIAFSAVLHLIGQYVSVHRAEVDTLTSKDRLDGLNVKAEDILKVVSTTCTMNGRTASMANAARLAKQLPIPYSQRFATDLFHKIQVILDKIYTVGAGAKKGVDIKPSILEACKAAIRMMDSPEFYTEDENEGKSRQQMTGSQYRISGGAGNQRSGAFINSTGDEKEQKEYEIPAKLRTDGETKVKLMIAARAKHAKEQGTSASGEEIRNTLGAFGSQLAELYGYFIQAGLTEGEWKAMVETVDRWYTSSDQTQRGLTSSLISLVKKVLAKIVNGKAEDVDELKKTLKSGFNPKATSEGDLTRIDAVWLDLVSAVKVRRVEQLHRVYTDPLQYRTATAASSSNPTALAQRYVTAIEQARLYGVIVPETVFTPSTGTVSEELTAFVNGLKTNDDWRERKATDTYAIIRQHLAGAKTAAGDRAIKNLGLENLDQTLFAQLEIAISEARGGGGKSFSSSSDPQKLSAQQIVAIIDGLVIQNAMFIDWCIANDVYHGLGALILRPGATWSMASAFFLKGGGQTGKTWIGWPDVMLASNAAQKMYYTHTSVYSTTAILNKAFLIHAWDIMCQGYVSGNGTRMYHNLDKNEQEAYKSGQNPRDIFVAPIPLSWKPELPFIDTCGFFAGAVGASAEVQSSTAYESAEIMCELYGWKHAKNQDPFDRSWNNKETPITNTICFQDTQFNYDTATGGWTHGTMSKGPWGPGGSAPGAGAVRNGMSSQLWFRDVTPGNMHPAPGFQVAYA